MTLDPQGIAIVQSGNIGDVIACFPMAALLRQRFPRARILFIARRYAQAAVEACSHIDEYLDEAIVRKTPAVLRERHVDILLNPHHEQDMGMLAKAVGIPVRIGNLRRPRTLLWANRFIYSAARDVQVHAANLNLRHLRALGLCAQFSTEEMVGLVDMSRLVPLDESHRAQIAADRFNLVLHPKSNGNAREWPPDYYHHLARMLPAERFRIFLTGSAAERAQLRRDSPGLWQHSHVVDLMGKFELAQLLAFINAADGLVAASTGPLHIAAAIGIRALGLFPGRASMNTTRWRPIGRNAEILSIESDCRPGPQRCPEQYSGEACACMNSISPRSVAMRVIAWDSRLNTRQSIASQFLTFHGGNLLPGQARGLE